MGYLGRQMAVSDCGILDNGELITYKLQIMKHLLILLFTACTLLTYAQVPEGYPANYAKAPRFKALIYYTQHAEEAHVQFAEQATTFFKKLNYGDGFVLDITTDFSKYPYEKLKEYNVIIMLNTYHRHGSSASQISAEAVRFGHVRLPGPAEQIRLHAVPPCPFQHESEGPRRNHTAD